MEHEGLRRILEDIESGDSSAARVALRPYLTVAHEAPSYEVRYVLGRAWFGEDNAIARYLFEQALALKADYAEAGQYEARCGSALEDLETFDDERHPACKTCGLRYRDHEPLCPYCGSAVTPPRDEHDGSFNDELRRAGEEVKDSFKAFSEREDVQHAKEKVVHAGQQAYAKARELADSETAQEFKGKAQELGKKTAAKAKEFTERDDVKKAVHQAQETSASLFQKFQDYVKAEQQRINASQGNDKLLIIGKWVVIGIVVLMLFKWIFGGD